MALKKAALFSQTTQDAALGYTSVRTEPKAFAATGGGAETYAILTPVTIEADGHCIVWANLAEIHGFVVQYPVTTDTSDEVMGNVMIQGEVNFEQIVLPDGEVQGNLTAELKKAYLQQRGIIVKNLAGKL